MAAVNKKRNALGLLVEQVLDANGWSMRSLEKRAADRGHAITHQRIFQMCTEHPLPSIHGDKIVALAVALGISPARVAVAALEAMGIPVADQGVSPAEAIARDPHLSEDTRAALLSILRTATERRRGA